MRTSLKTTFLTVSNAPSSELIMASFNFSGLPTLDNATYSCPWVNTCVLSQRPACFRVCPRKCILYVCLIESIYLLTLRLVDGDGKCCPDWKLSSSPGEGIFSNFRNE